MSMHRRLTVVASACLTIAGGLVAIDVPSADASAALFMQRLGGMGQGGGRFARGRDSTPVQLAAGIRSQRDVAYGPAPRQALDVYAPAAALGAPVIVMVHGGAWMLGDKGAKGVVEGKANRWVPRGFVFVSVNYRMVPEVTVAEEAQDVARALAFVQRHAAQWGGDGQRVVLMGHSAGAHLVMLVSASSAIAAAQGVKPWLGTIALDSAAYDVVELMQRPHFRFYDRAFGSDAAVWRADSPTLQLDRRIVPVLAVCSSQRLNSCPAARQFVDRAQSFHGQAQLLEQDKTHEQINKDLGVDPAYTQQVEAFMRTLDPQLTRLLGP